MCFLRVRFQMQEETYSSFEKGLVISISIIILLLETSVFWIIIYTATYIFLFWFLSNGFRSSLCSAKKIFLKFRRIAPVPESLF